MTNSKNIEDNTNSSLLELQKSAVDLIDLLRHSKQEIEDLQSKLQISLDKYSKLDSVLQESFPYEIYRMLRPDLATFSRADLLSHFINYGINENIGLSNSLDQNATAFKDLNLDNKRHSILLKELERAKIYFELLNDIVSQRKKEE